MEYSALMLAVVNGNTGIVRILLEHLSKLSDAEKFALINRQNTYQFTALHAACEQKNKDLIELLLEFGCVSSSPILFKSTLYYLVLPACLCDLTSQLWRI